VSAEIRRYTPLQALQATGILPAVDRETEIPGSGNVMAAGTAEAEPYRMIVVDDEAVSLHGMSSLIDWAEIGFTVTAEFDDGKAALEHLDAAAVDVVLADIRMPGCTGIDLARHVRDHHASVRVVLISGHREFEYAKQAIDCGVVHYLLKPFSLAEIARVFEGLREQLDRERHLEERRQEKERQARHLVETHEELLVDDILLGALRNTVELKRRLALLDHGGGLDEPACVLRVALPAYGTALRRGWDGDSERLASDMARFLRTAVGRIRPEARALVSHMTQEGAAVVIVPAGAAEAQEIASALEDSVRREPGLEAAVRVLASGITLPDLAAGPRVPIAGGDLTGMELPGADAGGMDRFLAGFSDQQRLLLSHLMGGRSDGASSILRAVLDGMSGLPLHVLKNVVLELFSTLTGRLRENGIDLYGEPACVLFYGDLVSFTTAEQVSGYAGQILLRISEHVARNGRLYSSGVIDRAKRYVEEHMAQEVSLEAVARHVFLSPVYFSRLFKERAGITFSAFVQRAKIERAVQLLRDRDRKVYEVCGMVGYSDLKHFHRVFRKQTGCSPNELRRMRRGG
jgi:two-component system, response regulator YesN